MPTTWIVIAERSRARIFEYRPGRPLAEIQGLAYPAGADLDTETEGITRAIARYLQRGYHERAFERLCLVAPPKFLGRLRAALGPPLSHVAGEDIPHEAGMREARELEPWLRQKGALRESLRPGAR